MGEAILGVFAIFIRDYVTLQWVMSVVTLVQVKETELVIIEALKYLALRGEGSFSKGILEMPNHLGSVVM